MNQFWYGFLGAAAFFSMLALIGINQALDKIADDLRTMNARRDD